jgi:HD superfamily phosphohydrolase
VTHIQDGLHGYIKLNKDEKELFDTPKVQRLRRIRQLGLSSLFYPSAAHTRFQHSLGVMHTSGRTFDADDYVTMIETIREIAEETGFTPEKVGYALFAHDYNVRERNLH